MNFPNSEEFANQVWICVGCTTTCSDTDRQVEGRRDTQAHIMVCHGYTEYRQNLELENEKNLVTYVLIPNTMTLPKTGCSRP